MNRSLVVVAVLTTSTLAAAEPHLRFGLTFGIDRNAAEAHEVGPMLAAGARTGRFAAEASYSYLSFADAYNDMHRAGVTLRMDALYWPRAVLYGELGAARKFGRWTARPNIETPTTSQNEVTAAVGYDVERTWQVAVRFGVARRDPQLGTTCRGLGCELAMPASTGLAESLMLEWTFTVGR